MSKENISFWLNHPPHHVSISPDNETVYEWWNNERKITIYVSSQLESSYVKVWGPDIYTEMEDGPLKTFGKFKELMEWMNE